MVSFKQVNNINDNHFDKVRIKLIKTKFKKFNVITEVKVWGEGGGLGILQVATFESKLVI